jgi:heptosyltransferase-2
VKPPGRPLRVLLRAPNWVGDAVLALPSVATLASRPDVRLTVLGPPYVHPIYDGLPGVSLSPVDPRAPTPLRAWGAGRALAGGDDVGILCPTSLSSAIVLWAARVPRRVGRAGDGRSPLLTDRLPKRPRPPFPLRSRGEYDPRHHRWRDYAELVEHVLGEPVSERYPLHVPDAARAAAARLLSGLAGAGPLIGLNPGANGPARRWPIERYTALGKALRDGLDARVAVVGSRFETDLAERVAGAVPGARSLGGRTDLKTLAAVLAELDLLVTNDTGPMHVAAALGTPLIALFGAGDDRVTAPRGPGVHVLRELLFCSPCVRSHCPYDLECMKGLATAAVLAEATRVLSERRPRREPGERPAEAAPNGGASGDAAILPETAPAS